MAKAPFDPKIAALLSDPETLRAFRTQLIKAKASANAGQETKVSIRDAATGEKVVLQVTVPGISKNH
ncbi:hypothetical protein AB4Y40_29910 [Paraburkholderia sp. EG287B]|uniref:hypothetical protein n=1 Tax=Paraburkholderia sp. EG287B TaxID=3237010 RepID=UPI0034D26DFD